MLSLVIISRCTCGKRILWLQHISDRHTHPFNGPFSGTTQVSWYQKGKTKLDFNEARDSEWQWHQLGHVQVCISLQTDNHASTPPLSFFTDGCPSCSPNNSIKPLKTNVYDTVDGKLNACCLQLHMHQKMISVGRWWQILIVAFSECFIYTVKC